MGRSPQSVADPEAEHKDATIFGAKPQVHSVVGWIAGLPRKATLSF